MAGTTLTMTGTLRVGVLDSEVLTVMDPHEAPGVKGAWAVMDNSYSWPALISFIVTLRKLLVLTALEKVIGFPVLFRTRTVVTALLASGATLMTAVAGLISIGFHTLPLINRSLRGSFLALE